MRFIWTAVTMVFALPTLGLAHSGVGAANGFWAGFSHPLLGFDHLAAMLAVGLWAAMLGGRARWVVPATFVMLMVFGSWLGLSALALPFVEHGILLSVLVLGFLVAGAFRLPLAFAAALVGFFALMHGHAHGTELPQTAAVSTYTAGFALATLALHALGLGFGLLTGASRVGRVVRLAGAVISCAGFYLALS